jgi:hypothetical protein
MKKQATPERRKRQPAKTVLKDAPSPQADDSRRVDAAFPIVGIGASAGGLEALDHFLRHVPEGNGMAFVIVQHLDPTRKGIMAELLQRATDMKVTQVKDRTRVQPDCVYVIPPNKDMSILHGVLHLLDPVAPRGLRLPIDFFFRSLAEDSEERISRSTYCAVRKIGDTPTRPHSPGESPTRGGGPPLSVGSVGRAEPLRCTLCKGEGLPRERSSAGNGVAIIPRC